MDVSSLRSVLQLHLGQSKRAGTIARARTCHANGLKARSPPKPPAHTDCYNELPGRYDRNLANKTASTKRQTTRPWLTKTNIPHAYPCRRRCRRPRQVAGSPAVVDADATGAHTGLRRPNAARSGRLHPAQLAAPDGPRSHVCTVPAGPPRAHTCTPARTPKPWRAQHHGRAGTRLHMCAAVGRTDVKPPHGTTAVFTHRDRPTQREGFFEFLFIKFVRRTESSTGTGFPSCTGRRPPVPYVPGLRQRRPDAQPIGTVSWRLLIFHVGDLFERRV